jgi:hypothetical protein
MTPQLPNDIYQRLANPQGCGVMMPQYAHGALNFSVKK